MISYINKDSSTDKMEMVEIGSYVGDSTVVFAKNFKTVYCIDPWVNGYDKNDEASYKHDMGVVMSVFDENIKPYDNVIKIRGYSDREHQRFNIHSLDMVYIDALHTYEGVKKDVYLWEKKIKKGGYLAGHDYQSRFQGVIDAVNEFKKPDMVFKDSSWIIKL